MWRICLAFVVAAAELTEKQLDDTVAAVQKTAEGFMEQMAEATQGIQGLANEIPTFPGKIFAASEEEKPKIEAEMKAAMKKMCKKLLALGALEAKISVNDEAVKEKVMKIQAQITQMAADPAKIKDETAFENKLAGITEAMGKLSASVTKAAPFLLMGSDCEASPALEKLFEVTPKSQTQLQLPSMLLGFVSGTAFVSFALLLFRMKSKSPQDRTVALMEEGNLE